MDPLAHNTNSTSMYDWYWDEDGNGVYSGLNENLSPYGYYYRNCTDYVAWRLVDSGVKASKVSGLGNANTWDDNAPGRGVTVNSSPTVGSVAISNAGSFGHVAYVTAVGGGNITVAEYNHAGTGVYGTRTGLPTTLGFSHFAHFEALGSGDSSHGSDGTITDGEFVKTTDTQNLYVMAGGSPMYVSNLTAVNWTDRYEEVKQADVDKMPMYPRDGTVLHGYRTDHVYVVAGGFAFRVMSLDNIPYRLWIDVDGGTIGSETRPLPADGTVIRDWPSKRLYTVVGGAALWVHDPATIGYTGHTDIDGWGITHQLLPYPANGAVFRVGDRVHVMAGGAPMQVNNMERIPPPSVWPLPFVDPWAVTFLMPQYPADGTVIRDYIHGSMYVVVGGWPSAIMHPEQLPYQGWVELDGWSIENQLRPFPMDGRFVVGKPSGRVYKIQNQTAVYVSSMSQVTSTPIAIDDWSLDNQLL